MKKGKFVDEYLTGLKLKRQELQQKRREELKLKGLCRVCGINKAVKKKSTCEKCRNKKIER